MNQPLEARCDHCTQTRPLTAYEPDCGIHLGAGAFTCPWCSIDKQPLLCTRCWSARKLREEADPLLAEEQEALAQICATNARVAARREARAAADRDTCDAIARTTEETP